MSTKEVGRLSAKRYAAQTESESPKVVKIDRSEAQLTQEEQIEAGEACGDVRYAVNALHNEALGLSRQIERPNHMLKRAALERHLRMVESHALNLRTALGRLPFMTALLLVACLVLSGCDKDCERCDGGSRESGVGSRAGAAPAVCERCQRVPVPAGETYALPKAPVTKAQVNGVPFTSGTQTQGNDR